MIRTGEIYTYADFVSAVLYSELLQWEKEEYLKRVPTTESSKFYKNLIDILSIDKKRYPILFNQGDAIEKVIGKK